MAVLKLGSTGPEVKAVQTKLKRLRFFGGTVNGVFDAATDAAVRDFQKKHLIEVDGKVGKQTRDTIARAIANLEASLVAPPATGFAGKLVKAAEEQWDKFHAKDEANSTLCSQIKTYWTSNGFTFTSCTTVPWSAVFVSFCVKQAGATADEFKFNPSHSQFVHAAIQNKINNQGVFHGLKPDSGPLKLGDILQVNRGGTKHDYDFAKKETQYASHSAIVVSIDLDGANSSAITIGGNEGNSIRKTEVVLNPSGVVKKRTSNPYISIVRRVA